MLNSFFLNKEKIFTILGKICEIVFLVYKIKKNYNITVGKVFERKKFSREITIKIVRKATYIQKDKWKK